MPRVIFKCPYLKGGSERAASHLHNYVRYMATREGAQHMAIGHEQLPATEEQRKMVAQLLREFPLSRGLFEYEDYQTAPTRGNASEFITRALEDNYDQIAKRDNYVSYIASRPRAQRAGAHALFTGSDAPLVLSQIAAEVAHHPGNVWLPIISLRREDAARLGYDDAGQWKNLIAGYAMEMAEATLRAIKSKLEAQGALNAIGKQEWTIKNLLSILSNEKYCGDALLQKTFIQDCISKKVIQNNGQLPKYLVQDHHEGIVSRDVFYAAQLEIARRRAQTGGTSKSAPTGRSKYSGKYILTNLMFCGHCGTGYRRCVWNKGGVKRAVWRCGSRLDYGAKYCKHSETLEEKPLQQAILNAINSVMDSRDALEVQLMGAMEQELAPIPGETMSLADIDRMLEELEKQFNSLLAEASAAGGTEDYAERFRMISNAMADLKEHKSRIKQVYQENELVSQRLKAASIAMSAYAAELTEWDQSVVYQLVEKVTVLAKDKIRVTFRNGTEVEQEIEQLDWRNAS